MGGRSGSCAELAARRREDGFAFAGDVVQALHAYTTRRIRFKNGLAAVVLHVLQMRTRKNQAITCRWLLQLLRPLGHVRVRAYNGINSDIAPCSKSAKSGSRFAFYSIISSDTVSIAVL